MTLPEICPLDENETCKGRECHLFCLEWRTREPTCLIGYNTTSKIRSGRAGRERDTYAEDTFRKSGRQPLPRSKNVSEKGDWSPTRPVERLPDRPAEKREEIISHAPSRTAEGEVQKFFFGCRETSRGIKPEKSPEERLEKMPQRIQVADEAEKASLRLEARLKKDPVEQDPIIYAKAQPRVQEKQKTQEKVISRDKHTTIFAPFGGAEKKNIYPSSREEKSEKASENREKKKKLDELMEIDLPDKHEKEFWS